MTIQIPNVGQALVNAKGMIASVWVNFFTQFGNPPSPAILQTTGQLNKSNSLKAAEPGNYIVTGGTISVLNLIRGTTIINLLGQKIIPVERADIVQIQYSVAPVIYFFPRY